jgi:hypothetical protein
MFDWFRKPPVEGEASFGLFTKRPFRSDQLSAIDTETLEKTQKFIEQNHPIIDQLSSKPTNNLFDNLENLLKAQPQHSGLIVKIKDTFDSIITTRTLPDFLLKINNRKGLNPDHLKQLIHLRLKKLNNYELLALSEKMQDYVHIDEQIRIEIAKFLAINTEAKLPNYIQNYGIKDKSALIEIAKIEAKKDPIAVSRSIKNFKITDQSALIELAKLAADEDPVQLSWNIQNYGIKDQSALIEFAKLASAKNPYGLSWYIQNYGITDQSALIAFARAAVSAKPLEILTYLDSFFLNENFQKTPEYKSLLFKALAYGMPQANNYSLSLFRDFKKFIALTDGDSKIKLESLDALEFFKFFKECTLKLESSLSSDFKSLSPCKKALAYRNKQIAFLLISIFLSEAFNPTYQAAYKSLLGTTVTELLSIVPAKWMVEAKTTLPSDGLLQFFKSFKHKLKDKDSGLMQMCLLTLSALEKFQGIAPERKFKLLSGICNRPKDDLAKVLEGLGYLYSFSMRGQFEILNGLDLTSPLISCKAAFEKLLTEDSFIHISDIPDFATLYFNSFDHTRIPLALEIYKAKLATLKNEPIRALLERFIRSVLLKTFNEERLRTDISPHLKTIEEKSSLLFGTWKSLEFSGPVGPSTVDVKQSRFSFRDFFETKLHDGHWNQGGKDLLPNLTAYLRKETIPNPSDSIPNTCKELIESTDLSKEEQIEKIQAILRTLTSLKLQGLELNNDLVGLVTTLIDQGHADFRETAIFSQDWQDLLLAGTEVAGSCQRIDGNPRLNQCLLAYCMDGKNAMIATKGKDGKILARSMLRLLWSEQEQKPALFLDRLYPNLCPAERKSAIANAAIKCAQKLNCDLFTWWQDYPSTPDNVIIESLEGPCPCDYADAAGGVMPDGIFKISNLRKMYLAT